MNKIPPQAIDLEEKIIGCALLIKDSVEKVVSVPTKYFYSTTNATIHKAIKAVYNKGLSVDLITVADELTKSSKIEDIGGNITLLNITSKIISDANLDTYIKLIAEKYVYRKLIEISSNLYNKSFEQEPLDLLLDEADRQLSQINEVFITGKVISIKESINTVVEQLSKMEQNAETIPGYSTGLKSLDIITNGFEEGDLITIAARPSMGKTAFIIQLMINMSENIPILFLSLEMPHIQISKRILASMTGIPLNNISRAKNLNWLSIESAVASIEKKPIYIEDESNITIHVIKQTIRSYVKKNKIKGVFIDYIQLIRSERETDPRLIVQESSRTLKALAKELNIFVVILSQLNREAEGRLPKLSHLKESGDIEQDSDKVLFPIRKDRIKDEIETMAEGIIRVEKNRNGRIGDCEVAISTDVTRWKDYEQEDAYLEPF